MAEARDLGDSAAVSQLGRTAPRDAALVGEQGCMCKTLGDAEHEKLASRAAEGADVLACSRAEAPEVAAVPLISIWVL
jgi:hypothetical protein